MVVEAVEFEGEGGAGVLEQSLVAEVFFKEVLNCSRPVYKVVGRGHFLL